MHMHVFTCHSLQCLWQFFFFSPLSLAPLLYLPLSLTSSQRFIPLMLMDPPPHVYLIKNQLKTPRRRVSRAEPRLRVEQKRFPHSLPLSLPLTITPSLSLSPSLVLCLSLPSSSYGVPHSLSSKLRPPVYWKLATWFTRTENLIYIFFSSCILSFIY